MHAVIFLQRITSWPWYGKYESYVVNNTTINKSWYSNCLCKIRRRDDVIFIVALMYVVILKVQIQLMAVYFPSPVFPSLV